MWNYTISLLLFFSFQLKANEFDIFVEYAAEKHKEEGTLSANFLLAGMPEKDKKELDSALLISNYSYAYRARAEFPWCKKLTKEQFLNDVLPYAILDETREDWRPQFYEICKELVKDCKTSSEAAQVINRDLFDKLNVHYSRKRNKPNQSPSESIAIHKASCTGLSIILAYGCRSVGIPARIVGTPLWSDKSGNHTWVEIWDGEWKFCGADEYDAKGLNKAWFVGRASKAKEDSLVHAIWATTWKPNKNYFLMIWAQNNKTVSAVNVTERYLKREKQTEVGNSVALRVFDKKGGSRIVATISQMSKKGEVMSSVKSRANGADMNDVAQLSLFGEAPWYVAVSYAGTQKMMTIQKLPEKAIDVIIAKEKEAFDYSDTFAEWKEKGFEKRQQELEQKVIKVGDQSMKFLERKYAKEPKGGHSLWISLHGGGKTITKINDQQWQNQIKIYKPQEGYYIAPRAPSDTWDLWHKDGIDSLVDRLITNYVLCKGVNPNRVYLMGYSAGGDGVYQLAPRMADRFAAASMMAGHPNDAQPDNLRNIHFEIFMGGLDTAYNRNKKAANWKVRLADLQKQDPAGYSHKVTIYPELGHNMKLRDAEALPSMAMQTRTEWPNKVVWKQDNVTHERFYWLGVKPEGAVKKRLIVGEVKKQTILLTGEDLSGVKLWLSDDLLDLDSEIIVKSNGEEVYRGVVKRSKKVVEQSLNSRNGMIATALIELE